MVRTQGSPESWSARWHDGGESQDSLSIASKPSLPEQWVSVLELTFSVSVGQGWPPEGNVRTGFSSCSRKLELDPDCFALRPGGDFINHIWSCREAERTEQWVHPGCGKVPLPVCSLRSQIWEWGYQGNRDSLGGKGGTEIKDNFGQ